MMYAERTTSSGGNLRPRVSKADYTGLTACAELADNPKFLRQPKYRGLAVFIKKTPRNTARVSFFLRAFIALFPLLADAEFREDAVEDCFVVGLADDFAERIECLAQVGRRKLASVAVCYFFASRLERDEGAV